MNNQDHASQEIRERERFVDIRLTIEDSKDLSLRLKQRLRNQFMNAKN